MRLNADTRICFILGDVILLVTTILSTLMKRVSACILTIGTENSTYNSGNS